METAKQIVEEYSQLPNIISIHLNALVPHVVKSLDSLPLTFTKTKKPAPVGKISYTFNEAAKMSDLVLV